jgi:hypothetical protein
MNGIGARPMDRTAIAASEKPALLTNASGEGPGRARRADSPELARAIGLESTRSSAKNSLED